MARAAAVDSYAFRFRRVAGTLGLFAALLGVACDVQEPEDEADSSEAALAVRFDKNLVVDDARFTDVSSRAPDVGEVQAFLDKTPFRNWLLMRTKSPLAEYREGGKLASEILVDVARANRINPIALLVALEAESSLVSATSAEEDRIKVAFRCVCPGEAACAEKPEQFVGFSKQAACYAKTMRTALDAQASGGTTESGWKRGVPKETGDRPAPLLVTPGSAATAALYDWTPVVGKAGGGDRALGGTSNWFELWKRFANALEYTTPGALTNDTTTEPPAPGACETDETCPEDAPVCDPGSKKCVPCTATVPGICAATTATPQCVTGWFSDPTCGCTTDAACGLGRVCDDDLGPAGLCVAGCRVRGGKDSCGEIGHCSVRNGGIGQCEASTSCTMTSCPANFRCDTSLATPTCIPIETPPPPAPDAGAPADDAGSDAGAHVPPPQDLLPESAEEPQQPPSGHGAEDRSFPSRPAPEFAPLEKRTPRTDRGCSATPSPASGSASYAAAFALALGAVVARRRRPRA